MYCAGHNYATAFIFSAVFFSPNGASETKMEIVRQKNSGYLQRDGRLVMTGAMCPRNLSGRRGQFSLDKSGTLL